MTFCPKRAMLFTKGDAERWARKMRDGNGTPLKAVTFRYVLLGERADLTSAVADLVATLEANGVDPYNFDPHKED